MSSAPVHTSEAEVHLHPRSGTPEKQTILVVEDDQLVRRSLETFIRSLGFSVFSASSAEEALDYTVRHPVHLLLTDFQLPVRNGIELASSMRTKGTKVPVVLLSGHLTDQARQEAKAAGIEVFLRKPADLGLLEQTLFGLFQGDSRP